MLPAAVQPEVLLRVAAYELFQRAREALRDGGDGVMRSDDHQFFQPMYISNLGPITKDQPFDEEGTCWGWKLSGKIDTQDTVLPTSCKMNRPS